MHKQERYNFLLELEIDKTQLNGVLYTYMCVGKLFDSYFVV